MNKRQRKKGKRFIYWTDGRLLRGKRAEKTFRRHFHEGFQRTLAGMPYSTYAESAKLFEEAAIEMVHRMSSSEEIASKIKVEVVPVVGAGPRAAPEIRISMPRELAESMGFVGDGALSVGPIDIEP